MRWKFKSPLPIHQRSLSLDKHENLLIVAGNFHHYTLDKSYQWFKEKASRWKAMMMVMIKEKELSENLIKSSPSSSFYIEESWKLGGV